MTTLTRLRARLERLERRRSTPAEWGDQLAPAFTGATARRALAFLVECGALYEYEIDAPTNIRCDDRDHGATRLWRLKTDLMVAFDLTNEEFKPPWWPDGHEAWVSGADSGSRRPWYPAWLAPPDDQERSDEHQDA